MDSDSLIVVEQVVETYRGSCLCGKVRFTLDGSISSDTKDPDRIRIRLGAIDSDIKERPVSHNFVSSKACWEDLDDELPRSDGYETGRE
jgi:hypothetical protein